MEMIWCLVNEFIACLNRAIQWILHNNFFFHVLPVVYRLPVGRGGFSAKKYVLVYTPAGTAMRNPYPKWHKICQTLPLLAQNLGPNPYVASLIGLYKTLLKFVLAWVQRILNFGSSADRLL